MKRSLLLFLLLAAPVGADPLFAPSEYVLWSRLAIHPDIVRGAPARGAASGGSGSGDTLPVSDATSVVEGSSDDTKEVRFEVDGLTTATIRVITVPDANTVLPVYPFVITYTGPSAARTVTYPDASFSVAGLGVAQTFSAANVFTPGVVTFGTAIDAANSIMLNETANCITFEGTAADTNEGKLCGSNGGIDSTTSLVYLAATQTMAVLEGTQTFTGAKTFGTATTTFALAVSLNNSVNLNLGTTTGGQLIQANITQTPDTVILGTGTASNSWHIAEAADVGSDLNNGPCLAATCTHPTLVAHSAAQDVINYSSISSGGIAGKTAKTLTESAATDTVKVSLPAEAGTAGEYLVTVYATDGATPQVRQIRILFAATNDGGVTTCTLGTPETTDHTPTGTLTATVTCVDGTAALLLQVNAVSDLTQTTLESYSQVILAGPGQILPQ